MTKVEVDGGGRFRVSSGGVPILIQILEELEIEETTLGELVAGVC